MSLKAAPKSMSQIAREIEALLQTQMVNSQVVTVRSLTLELNQAIKLSKVFKQPAAMVAAIKAKAQIHGFLKEKVEHEGEITHTVKVEKVELEERIRQLIGEELADVLR